MSFVRLAHIVVRDLQPVMYVEYDYGVIQDQWCVMILMNVYEQEAEITVI